MSDMKISLAAARRLAIAAQGLGGRGRLPRGKEGAARIVERLGYVQIDTISTLQRAHHHILWSRRPDYTPQMLHELQAQDRRVFEYWTHAAALVPMRDYRFYLPRMRRYAESAGIRGFLKENARLVGEMLARIGSEGSLGSSDFEAPAGKKRGSWGDWKPAKQALEYLFWCGKLMVSERRSFQRMYDLTERVLPAGADTRMPSADESAQFLVRRVLGGVGVSNFRQWSLRKQFNLTEALRDLEAMGEVTQVRIEGHGSVPHFALTAALKSASRGRLSLDQVHILSPFDNLVIWRVPLKSLFEFDYKLECYVPAPKRRYGYFCLPILWGEQFVARLDAKAQREEGTLLVHTLTFEPKFQDFDELLPHLARKLQEFATFNGCHHVRLAQVKPRKALAALTKMLKRFS